MTVTASRPAAPVVAPAPQAAPTAPEREPNSPPAAHPFAEMLRQNRSVVPAPPEAPHPARPADAAEHQTSANEGAGEEATPATNELSTRSDAGRARTRAAASARSGARATSPTERPGREHNGVAPGEHPDDDDTPAGDATAANAAGVARPEAPRPNAAEPRVRAGGEAPRLGEAAERRASTATNAPGAVVADADIGGASRRRLETDSAVPADAGRSASRARDNAAPAAAASFAQTLAETKTADRQVTPAGGERSLLPAFDPGVAPHEPLPRGALAGDASALATTTLPAPIDSPEFASALGVQVSVFVREGVQHAELHLNPAETGPVSIAITLEGTQARVEFGADLAATRQAIENGLPALASALRDAGFTLAGGGVAQHSRSGGSQGDGDEPAGRGDPRRGPAGGNDAVVAAGPRAASHRIAAGGVDVYA